MSLPDKATKHIPKHQVPIGAVKDGKVKIKDGETGKVGWRQGKKGFRRDYDGEPIAANFNNKDLKPAPKHHMHEGRKPHKGS